MVVASARLSVLAAGFAVAASGSQTAAAAESGGNGRWIGFRHDGAGVWPDDCTPVTKWNEWDFKKVTVKDAKGKEQSREVPDKENRVNIVWKSPLKSACNGGMILVKGKLYMLVDRGGYAYATEWTPDFVGSRLVCMDPKDGNVLWQKDYDHLGELPKEEAEKKRKDVLDFYAWWTKAFGTFNRWHAATRQRSQDRNLDTPERQKTYEEAARAAKELGIPVPETVEALKASPEWMKTGGTYNQCAFWGLYPKYFPDRKTQYGRVVQAGYPYERWFGEASYIGVNLATPASDGKRIWFSTGHFDAFCVDLDGNLVWATWIKEKKPQGMFGSAALVSAVLTEDRLIGVWGDNNFVLKGLDRQTGKVVWEEPNKVGGHTSMQRMLVPMGTAGKNLEVMYYGTGGKIYRARDGKLLLNDVANHQVGRPQGIIGNVLIIGNGGCDGGNGKPVTYPKGLVAVRLTAESEDTLKQELVWNREDISTWICSSIHDGLVYVTGKGEIQALDVATGKTVGKVALPRDFRGIHHFASIAGGYLFGFDNGGAKCVVVSAGKEPKIVSVNRLGKTDHGEYGAFNQGGQPFFSGNRMFYRSYTDVYCIGDPAQPLRLSKEHQ